MFLGSVEPLSICSEVFQGILHVLVAESVLRKFSALVRTLFRVSAKRLQLEAGAADGEL